MLFRVVAPSSSFQLFPEALPYLEEIFLLYYSIDICKKLFLKVFCIFSFNYLKANENYYYGSCAFS